MARISDYDKWLYDQVDRYMEEQDMKCCDNCLHYIGDYCLKDVNNADEDLIRPEYAKDPDDYCDDWEYNEMSD